MSIRQGQFEACDGAAATKPPLIVLKPVRLADSYSGTLPPGQLEARPVYADEATSSVLVDDAQLAILDNSAVGVDDVGVGMEDVQAEVAAMDSGDRQVLPYRRHVSGYRSPSLSFSPTSPGGEPTVDHDAVRAAIDRLFPDEGICSDSGDEFAAPQRGLTEEHDGDIDGSTISDEEWIAIRRQQAFNDLPAKIAACRKELDVETRARLLLDARHVAIGKVDRGFVPGAPSPGQGRREFEPPRKISRDSSCGVDPPSKKEIRDSEDHHCNAGMRNPALVCKRWPSLVAAMRPIRATLLRAYAGIPDLQKLPLAVGANAVRLPPRPDSIRKVRAMVAETLGLTEAEGEIRHPAGNGDAA